MPTGRPAYRPPVGIPEREQKRWQGWVISCWRICFSWRCSSSPWCSRMAIFGTPKGPVAQDRLVAAEEGRPVARMMWSTNGSGLWDWPRRHQLPMSCSLHQSRSQPLQSYLLLNYGPLCRPSLHLRRFLRRRRLLLQRRLPECHHRPAWGRVAAVVGRPGLDQAVAVVLDLAKGLAAGPAQDLGQEAGTRPSIPQRPRSFSFRRSPRRMTYVGFI